LGWFAKNEESTSMLPFLQYYRSILSGPILRRCSVFFYLYAALEAFYLLWKVLVIIFYQADQGINIEMVRNLIPTNMILMSGSALIGLIIHCQPNNPYFSKYVPLLSAWLLALVLCYHGYLVGTMTPATGMMMTGLPMLGILLLGPRTTYPALVGALLIISTLTYLGAAHLIPYAPIFNSLPVSNAAPSLLLISSIGFFCIPILLVMIFIFDLVIRQWRASEAENERLLKTDALTGLYNRRHLHQYLEQQSQSEKNFSISILDIDFFKRVNDQCGHLAGDRVLADIAQVLRQQVRAADWIGRFGGEEFIVIMPDTDAQTARQICEDCRMALNRLTMQSANGETWPLTASFGLVNLVGPFDASHTLTVADEMLYQAKQRGRNCVVFGTQLRPTALALS